MMLMDKEVREEFRRLWSEVSAVNKTTVRLVTQMESVVSRLDFNNKTGAAIFVALVADIVTHFWH